MESSSPLSRDRVYESLERGHDWFRGNTKWIAIIIVVALVSTLTLHYRQRSTEENDRRLLAVASKLEKLDEKVAFVRRNPQASSAVPLYLSAAREYLEGGKAEEALGLADDFIKHYPEHQLQGLAHLLKGYAHEELSQPKQAVEAYKKVLELEPLYATLAEEGLSRLKDR